MAGGAGAVGGLRWLRLFAACIVVALASAASAKQPLPRSMLILHPSDGRGPFYYDVFASFRSTVNAADAPVTLYLEHLDLSRFTGAAYEQSLEAHLRVKYLDKPIGVIVAVGPAAFEYVMRRRAALWPGVPVVFTMVDEPTVARLKGDSDVTGSVFAVNFDDMMRSARAIVPDLRRIAIVGDRLQTQPTFAGFAPKIAAAGAEVEVIDFTGLPMAELRKRVAALPDRTAILYTAVYSDGAGTYYPPSDAVALIAEVANRPIVVAFETFLGRGAAGGYVVIPAAVGAAAARLALRVLDGDDRSPMPSHDPSVVRPVFDARQLTRWGVDESRLPLGSEVRFRPPSAWQQYRSAIVATLAVLVVQSALIVGLLYERRRRRLAETETRQRTADLAHMNRHATAGELTASIAHELNQPLGAILNNAESAIAMLGRASTSPAAMREILEDIKRDDQRASAIITRLRRLLRKAPASERNIDLNEVVREVFELLAHEAAARDVHLASVLAPRSLPVNGDRVQLQQVVLNLLVNAIESVAGVNVSRRTVVCRTVAIDHNLAEVSVADSGPGLRPDDVARVFEPFFTTKEHGMGMGLSISRTIVEAHGGRISAENQAAGGAVFRVSLPLADN